jgi:membrane-bound inhibitor of C-type lysozyme
VYTCSDQSSLKVTYTRRGRARVQYGSSDWTLPHVKSASGARYKSGATSVWNKGTELLFEHDGKKLTCSE